jgi:uncharacterized protein (DUF697 family)
LIKFLLDNKLIFFGIHVVIGYACTFDFVPKPYAYAVILAAVGLAIFSSNRNEESLLLAAYIVGVEVFLRMTKGAPLFETGKYSIILLLTLGLLLGPTRQKLTLSYVFYLLLLLPGIIFTQVPEGESLRKSIAFNLSGPFMLGVCAIYFYKRRVKLSQLYNAMYMALLPMFSMITYMFFKTPDLKEIAFGGVSLGETSGGFGPNQVATIIGFGMFIIGAFILTKRKLTGFVFLDALILAYFTYRGLLTFSRGGVVTAGIALIAMGFFYVLFRRDFRKLFQYIFVAGIFILGVWLYTSDVTGGMIANRYTGRNASGIKKDDPTAGRLKIINTQLENFQEAPLFGIGVGNGKYERQLKLTRVTAASHNEVTRLIEEHGLIGLIILIILFFVPTSHIIRSDNFQRSFVVAFFLFWFLTINHSAMRIAFPGFVYGLSLINIERDEDEE